MSEGPLDRERWTAECGPTSVFLERGGTAIGYAFWNGDGTDVHVRHVVVDRAVRGQGHGRVLMLELAKLLRARGARNWRLSVLTSNTAAIGLYTGLGFEKAYETQVLRLETRSVRRLPRSPARTREASADSDSEHEQRFDLLAGQLARSRGYKSVRVLESRLPDGAVVGLAVFDPQVPGAFPFRVRGSEHARALIEAMLEVPGNDKDFVQLVIEDDLATAQALERAGATRTLEILHMRGAIPK